MIREARFYEEWTKLICVRIIIFNLTFREILGDGIGVMVTISGLWRNNA
jgi:hypothetical protein